MKKLLYTFCGAVALLALGTPCHAARQTPAPDGATIYDELVYLCDYCGLSTYDALALLGVTDPGVDTCVGSPGGWP